MGIENVEELTGAPTSESVGEETEPQEPMDGDPETEPESEPEGTPLEPATEEYPPEVDPENEPAEPEECDGE